MIKVREAIIVEGKHDKVKLSSIVNGLILETNGFRIFKDRQKLNLIRKLAVEKGIIIFTDSDSAGFVIRNYLKSSINEGRVLHAYIPDVIGKEKRKSDFSKERKLGVEGMNQKIIEDAINRSGASADFLKSNIDEIKDVIRIKMYDHGFYGCKFSKDKREKLKNKLNLPNYLTTDALIDIMSRCFNEFEICKILNDIENRIGD